MALSLLAPLRVLMLAYADDAAARLVTKAVTRCLAVVAVVFLVAAGLVGLAAVTGFSIAALVFAALFAALALAAHFIGKRRAARRAAQIAAAHRRATCDFAAATVRTSAASPLLSLLALLAGFALGRRK